MKIEETVAALTFVINELTEEIRGLRTEIEELKEMQDMEIVFTPEEDEEGGDYIDKAINDKYMNEIMDDSIKEALELYYRIFEDSDEDENEEGE